MKRQHLVSLAAVLAVSFGTFVFAHGYTRASAADASSVFSRVAPKIKSSRRFAVLLPTYLPDEGAAVYAHIDTDNSSAYVVDIAFDPACHGQAVCSLGSVSGSTAPMSLSGTSVKLASGITAYYVSGKCTAYCAASTITWKANNAYYKIALRGASQSDLTSVANSMTTY